MRPIRPSLLLLPLLIALPLLLDPAPARASGAPSIGLSQPDDSGSVDRGGTTMPQIWKLPVSPKVRWNLIPLFLDAKAKIADAQRGKAFRRVYRALGIDAIYKVLEAHENQVSSKLVLDERPVLHTITAENLDYLLTHLANAERAPQVELVVGDFFDALEELGAKRADEAYSVPAAPGLAAYDPAAEDWTPPERKPQEVKCPSCGQVFALDEEKAEAAAA